MAVASYDRPLSASAMTERMEAIVAGRSAPEETSAFLSGLAARGETAEEIAAAAAVLRRHAVPVPLSRAYALCDTCGTGGDGRGTVNVSTLAGLVAAGAGVRVAKHGNRAASSRCGSADMLEALGVTLDATPQQVGACIEQAGFGFCFAPRFHPAMKAVAPIRKALGIRTLFNLIGPLANPLPLAFQLVGVSDARLLRPMAEALGRLGVRRGLVVRGRDGLDEVTTTAVTDAIEVDQGRLAERTLDAASFGLPRAALEQLRGGDAARNARLAREVLEGQRSPIRDIILLNAGCAVALAGQAPDIAQGVRRAAEAIDSGAARRVLAQVQELTRHAG